MTSDARAFGMGFTCIQIVEGRAIIASLYVLS